MSHLLHLLLDSVTASPSSSPVPKGTGSVPTLIDPPPNNNAPGGEALSQLVGAFKFYGLVFSGAGLVISGIVFGIGRYIANQYAAVGGRIGLFACLGTAVVVGGSGSLVQWAFGLGLSIHP
ncbi:hypothetical protein GCM10029978_068010 [Actinoallomurus acanthiterrae]